MAEKFEDLNLPNAVVTRITKEALPDSINISKDSRTALSKAASVFVLYITSAASNLAMKNNRKTISGQDVIRAMEEVELDSFIGALKEALENFKKTQKEKKDAVAKRKLQKDGKKQGDSYAEEETTDKDSSAEVTEDLVLGM